jgi:glycine cleavage system regulatory protein
MTDLVLTLLGPDRPGLVELVAGVIAANGGNWLESRMSRLGGKFAGILRAELPPDRLQPALAALAALESGGLKVIAEAAPETGPGASDRSMNLELVGLDRPGIVREIAQLLAASGVNVEELVTNRSSAPMSGEMLFEARAHVRVPAGIDLASLRGGLERLASDLVVEVKLEDRATTGSRR